jgi:hypothetical protein
MIFRHTLFTNQNFTLTFVAIKVNRLYKQLCKLGTTQLRPNSRAAANSTFAIGGVSYSADSFVVKESAVLRINISDEKPAHRKSAKRWQTVFQNKLTNKRIWVLVHQ